MQNSIHIIQYIKHYHLNNQKYIPLPQNHQYNLLMPEVIISQLWLKKFIFMILD